MNVFISYAREDAATADRLYEALTSVPGVLPWLDRHRLLPGQDWEREVRRAMEGSDLIALLLSNNSVDKEGFVQNEVRQALALAERLPPGQIYLLPIRIEACVPRFDELRKLHWVDLYPDWASGLSAIKRAIEERQVQVRAVKKKAGQAQREKNRADAALLKPRIPADLLENLSRYSEWLFRHDMLSWSDYDAAREGLPNWTKQAEPAWIELLQEVGALEPGNGAAARFTDVGLELLNLVDRLTGTSTTRQEPEGSLARPIYRSMARPVEDFVERPELAELVEILTRRPEAKKQEQITVALTTALRGAGGFGKTTLAQALCQHEEVRQRFPAGTLWATLGEEVTDAHLIARIRDLLRWWSRKEPPAFETVEGAAAALREALSGQRVLLVLDDVWQISNVAPFAGMDAPAALLLTTRNSRVAPPGSWSVVVDALDLPKAVELLTKGLSSLPDASLMEGLATRLGEWPILLKLVNAQLREEYREGTGPAEAFQLVEETLEELGLTAFDREDEEARNLAVRRTVEASLRRLSAEYRQSYSQLAIFPEDEHVPLTVLRLLWNERDTEVHQRCRRFAEMSLLYRFDPVARSIQLHDVMRAYMQSEHCDELPTFHGSLIDAYLVAQDADTEPATSAYFVSRLPFHLSESGRRDDLEDLLFDYGWLSKKLAHTEVNSAIADYHLLQDHRGAETLREALLLSRSVLNADPSQLAGHLHGRLAGSESRRIQSLLAQAGQDRSQPWLRPLTATLQAPSGPLVFSFQAHQGEVQAIVEIDDERFATAGTDGEIHVWDLSGELLATLSGTGCPIRHLASPNPKQALAGSDDGVIRLWDLEEERLIRVFDAHVSAITALRLRQESFISGSDDGGLLHWKLDSTEPIGSFRGHESRIHDLGFLDSRTIVSVGKDRSLRVWHLQSHRQQRALTLPKFAAEALEVASSSQVVLGTFAGEIQIWNPLSRETGPRRSLRHPASGLDALALLARDLGVSAAGGQSAIRLWNPSTCELGPKVHVPGGGVTALMHYGAQYLLCGSKDGKISAWAISALREQMLELPSAPVFAVDSVDVTVAVSTSATGKIHVWDAPSGHLVRSLEGHTEAANSVCTLAQDRVASSSFADQTIRIWNPHTGELLMTLRGQRKPGALAALGEGLLISAPVDSLTDEQPMYVWDLARGEKLREIPSMPGGVATLCAINSRFLLVGTYGGLVIHLDISAAIDRRNFALRGHEKGVVSLAAIGGSRLASGSIDRTIRIWDLELRTTLQVLRGHKAEVTGLASLSPQLLASASQDQTIKVWDIDSQIPVASLQMDTGLSSLTAMPDRSLLVAGDAAGKVHFLRIEGLSV